MACSDNLDTLHLNYLEFFQTCPKCKYPDPRNFDFVVDEESYILGKSCRRCQEGFVGLDDTLYEKDVQDILKKMKASLCECGNDDMSQYTFQESEGKPYLLCSKCNNAVKSSSPKTYDDHPEEYFSIECTCGNTGLRNFLVSSDEENGEVSSITCGRCFDVYNIRNSLKDLPIVADSPGQKKVYQDSELKYISKSKQFKVQIDHACDLEKGDHICFWRDLRWEHHAIVTEVYKETNQIEVIHYYPTGKGGPKGMVQSYIMCLDKDHNDTKSKGVAGGIIYKLNYNGQCFSPDEILRRAKSRLGETEYNFITQNCEHFARWCMTDVEKSQQVCDMLTTLKHTAINVSTAVAKHLLKVGAIRVIKRILATGARSAALLRVDNILKATTPLAEECAAWCCPPIAALNVIGCIAIAGFEIYNTYSEIKKSKKEYEDQLNNCKTWSEKRRCKDRYDNERVGSVTKGLFKCTFTPAAAVAGTMAGCTMATSAALGTVGSFICPLVGSAIGATLGSVVGWGLSKGTKWLHAKWQKWRGN